MKQKTPFLFTSAIFLLVVGAAVQTVRADVVYVTSNVSNCAAGAECQLPNQDFNPNTGYPIYTDSGFGAYTSAKATAEGRPVSLGSRYFSTSFSNSTPDLGITLNPALGTPGGVYAIYHAFSSSARNVSSNIVVGVTNSLGATLSFTETDKFQAPYGNANNWTLLGYLTNDPGSANPMLTFYFLGGDVSAANQQRLITDTFRFSLVEPCLQVPVVRVTGPLATNITTVAVTGASTNATAIRVYQDSGAGMVLIGSTNVTNPTGTLNVNVAGLVRGAQVAATQTIGGQEGCVPPSGTVVGGGANPAIRVAFNIRAFAELQGPVGAPSSGTNSTLFMLGASSVLSGGAPEQGVILTPSTNWQTLTFTRGDVTNDLPIDPSVRWNGTNTFEGDFGGFDGVAIASEGDTGPYEIYFDDLANGTNGIVQDWETATNNAVNFGFNNPAFSGTTSANLLSAPAQAVVTSEAAASGTQSLRVRFQFQGQETNRWVRLVTANSTSGVANPQVDLNEPISIKVLLLPIGVRPVSPLPSNVSIARSGDQVTINWNGTDQLQTTTSLTGEWSDVAGATNAPYTTTIGAESRFFRLRR